MLRTLVSAQLPLLRALYPFELCTPQSQLLFGGDESSPYHLVKELPISSVWLPASCWWLNNTKCTECRQYNMYL